MCPGALGPQDGVDLALAIEHNISLGQVKVETPSREALLAQERRQVVHARQHRTNGWIPTIQGPWIAIQILSYACVGQARLATDDRVHDFIAYRPSVRREFDENTQRQAVYCGLQATDIVRQTGRQHGDHPVWQVDTRAALRRLAV